VAESDTLGWIADLPRLENYDNKEQYRDFRKVFMGTEEGKRVLRRIMELGSVFQQSALVSPVDPYMLAAFRGRSYLALKILSIVNNEPAEPPTQTTKRED
jgi:hypothetical protein